MSVFFRFAADGRNVNRKHTIGPLHTANVESRTKEQPESKRIESVVQRNQKEGSPVYTQ